MGRSGHITSFAIDVTTLEPYKSCGQLANKAQGSALGSLVPNQNVVFPLLQQNKKDSNKCHYPFYMGWRGQYSNLKLYVNEFIKEIKENAETFNIVEINTLLKCA